MDYINNFRRSNGPTKPIEVHLQENFKFIMSRKSDGNMGKSNEFNNTNRIKFFSNISVAPDKVVALQQEHTRRVFIYSEINRHCPIGDGLIISNPSLIASITIADCLPIALYDEMTGIFCLAHSGWKGTGIIIEAISKMESEFNIKSGNLHAVLGPCIQNCCYQTDQRRASLYTDLWGTSAVRCSEGEFYLDLQRANITMLEEIGISSITTLTDCTKCGDNFGSYRQEGPNNFTRMVAVAGFIKEK
jgi:polyphenol oxidase